MPIKVVFFGKSREISSVPLDIQSEQPLDIRQLKKLIVDKLSENSEEKKKEAILLLNDCAFAAGETILHEDDSVTINNVVSVLPPVCGG